MGAVTGAGTEVGAVLPRVQGGSECRCVCMCVCVRACVHVWVQMRVRVRAVARAGAMGRAKGMERWGLRVRARVYGCVWAWV